MRKSSSGLRKIICLYLKTLYHGGKKASINVCVCFLSDLFNILSFHTKPTEAMFAWHLLQGKYYYLIQVVHICPLNFYISLPIAENKN